MMSLFDEINKRTQLPKPRKPAQFETIDTSTDDEKNPPVVFNRNCKSKNIKLYNPDPEDYIGQPGNSIICANDFEITSSILELNGGDCHSNKAIEERWKARVSQKQAQQENDENKFVTKKSAIKEVKEKDDNSGHCQYKNNALMRNLLEQKMAELDVSNFLSSSSDGGKNIENNLPINGAMLTANPDDLDFFCLRDTSNMTDMIDNNFRFEHRGTKKKTTSRIYSIYEIDDDDFIFRKKS